MAAKENALCGHRLLAALGVRVRDTFCDPVALYVGCLAIPPSPRRGQVWWTRNASTFKADLIVFSLNVIPPHS